MFTEGVVFQFGKASIPLKSMDEIGIEAFLEQIGKDDRPYAHVPFDMFKWARECIEQDKEDRATNTEISDFLFEHVRAGAIKHRVEVPVSTPMHYFSW